MARLIKGIIFDWGDTLMRDFPHCKGPMAYWEQVEAIPCVNEALEMICTDYTCCVASNAGDSNSELMGLALNRVDLTKYFKHLFTSNELGVTKPNREFFIKILRNLNLQPDECIMVGNDYEKDIIPAKAVGLHTIFFTKEKGLEYFTNADYLMNSMDELSEIIKNFTADTE